MNNSDNNSNVTFTQCNFSSDPSKNHLKAVTALADAAKENAKAISLIAGMVKAPETMIKIGN